MREGHTMDFSMQVASPEEIKKEVALATATPPEELDKLREQAKNNALSLMQIDMDSLPDKRNVVKGIESFGLESLQKSSQKNSLLTVTVGKLSQAGGDGGQVSKSLLDLHREINARRAQLEDPELLRRLRAL